MILASIVMATVERTSRLKPPNGFGVDRGAGPGWGGHYSTAFRMVSTAAMRMRTSDMLASMAAMLAAICD